MLKVLTFNLNYYADKYGSWPDRKDLIYSVLRSASPDIAIFQAVARSALVFNGMDAARQLQELLPEYRYHFFQSAAELGDGVTGGSAILSRLEPAETRVMEMSFMSGLDDPFRRTLIRTSFRLPSGPLHILNAHFSWVEEQAKLNIQEALEAIQNLDGKVLLAGDMNTPAGSELFGPLREQNWTDAWESLNPAEGGATFESGQPSIRIDYMWVNAALLPSLRKIEIVGDFSTSTGVRPSDHFGLLAAFELPAH